MCNSICKILVLLFFCSVGLHGQSVNSGCFQNLENKSGFFQAYEGGALSDVSCELKSITDSLGGNDFLVGSIIGYPLRYSFNAEDGMDYLRNTHLGALDVLTQGYFVFFIDYSKEREGEVSYELSLPYSGEFANLDEGERRYIHMTLDTKFDENNSLGFEEMAHSMIVQLSGLLSNAESLDFNVVDLGFTELQFESEVIYPNLSEKTDGISTHLDGFGIHDYSGLLSDGSPLGDAVAEVPDLVSLEIGVYVTSNISTLSETYFNQALSEFGQESEKFSLWVHVIFDQEEESYRLFGKSHTNLTEDQALLWLADYFNERESNEVLSLTAREESDVLRKTISACDGKPSDFSGIGEKLFSGNNSHGKDWTLYCIWADDYIDSPNVVDDPFGVYAQARVGTTAGVGDGLIGTIFGIGALLKGFNFVRETTPFSISFWTDLVKDAIRERSVSKAWEIKKQDALTMWNIFKLVGKFLLKSQEPFWLQGIIVSEIIKYLKSIAGSSALYNTAYISGLIIFEVIVEVLTAGSAFAVTALARLANLGADVGRFGTKLAAMGKRGANRLLDQTRWGEFFTNIQSGMKRFDEVPRKRTAVGAHHGCFLGATLVALSGGINATPIQDVKLFDLVESKETAEAAVIASADADWGAEEVQLTDITLTKVKSPKERWLVGKFRGVSDSTILTVARKADWFRNNRLKIGSISSLSLSELGLSGEYQLTNVRELDSREYRALSLGEGRSRPVTATVSYPVPFALQIYTNSDTIGVTPNHLFFSGNRSDWTAAGDLKEGELIETLTGKVEIQKIDTLNVPDLRVYNIEVDENHNYYVGTGQLLVHNTCLAYVEEIFRLFPENSSGTVRVLEPGTGRVTDQIDELGTYLAHLDAVKKSALLNDLRSLPKLDQGKMVKSVRAWEALYGTALRTDTYWLGRVDRWKNAGLGFSFVQNGNKVKILRGTDEVAEISDDLQYLKINFNGFGGDIFCPLDQTVTVIGRYHENQPLQGIWYLTKDLKLNKHTSIPHNQMTQTNVAALGRNPGGLNALDVPPSPFYNWGLNQDWLYEAAVVRGDIIRILDDPNLLTTRWVYGRPPGHPNYLGPTRTGQEIDFLESYGFVYDNTIPGYRKP